MNYFVVVVAWMQNQRLWAVIAACGVAIVLTACEFDHASPSSSEEAFAAPYNVSIADTDSATLSETYVLPTEKHWLEVEVEGVNLGLWLPDEWFADYTDGLLIADKGAVLNGSTPVLGMVVYFFVPPLETFDLSPDITHGNLASHVLDQVVTMPQMLGASAVSTPVAFLWGDHPAAYYLLTSDIGTKTLVLAVSVPGTNQLIVCNISLPSNMDAEHLIRDALPWLFEGMTLNGTALNASVFDSLPEVFVFPNSRYQSDVHTTPEATTSPL